MPTDAPARESYTRAMKHLFKLAVGAAIAGAVVGAFAKRRARGGRYRPPRRPGDAPRNYDENYYRHGSQVGDGGTSVVDPGESSLPTELVADHQSVGEGSGDDRVQLPDDGRVGQGPVH